MYNNRLNDSKASIVRSWIYIDSLQTAEFFAVRRAEYMSQYFQVLENRPFVFCCPPVFSIVAVVPF